MVRSSRSSLRYDQNEITRRYLARDCQLPNKHGPTVLDCLFEEVLAGAVGCGKTLYYGDRSEEHAQVNAPLP